MKELINILHDEGLTLVVQSADGTIHCFTQRGVKDLFELVKERAEVLHGAIIADKAVGKAAAACMVTGGVSRVYADVMSEPALALLQQYDVIAEYGTLVDHIINRTGTDWCPMEKLSHDISDPAAIITAIEGFLKDLAK